MLARLVLALAFAAALPAQPGCISYRPSPTVPGLYWLSWNRFFAEAHHVEFVPFAGGIAAVVIVGNHTAHSPTPITTWRNVSCPARDLVVHGWAWSHTARRPEEVSVVLQGVWNGTVWHSPPVDVRARPAGVEFLLARLDVTTDNRLGVMVVDGQGALAALPDLAAYLVAPAAGGW